MRVITNYYLTKSLLPAPFAGIGTIYAQEFAVKIRLGGKSRLMHDFGYRAVTDKQPSRRLTDAQLVHVLRDIHPGMLIDGLRHPARRQSTLRANSAKFSSGCK